MGRDVAKEAEISDKSTKRLVREGEFVAEVDVTLVEAEGGWTPYLSLETEVDTNAEAAWSTEIQARRDRVDAGTAKTLSWAEARRRIHAAARRGNGA